MLASLVCTVSQTGRVKESISYEVEGEGGNLPGQRPAEVTDAISDSELPPIGWQLFILDTL
jgi:hypothetical protein